MNFLDKLNEKLNENEKLFRIIIIVISALIIIGVALMAILLVSEGKENDSDGTGSDFLTDERAKKYYEYVYSDNDEIYLKLVSPKNKIGRFVPDDLVTTSELGDYPLASSGESYYIERRCAYALISMLSEAESEGVIGIKVTSAYRSYDKQVSLFDYYVDREMSRDPSITKEEATNRASKFSNPPGCSEHQTGLCVDLYDVNKISTRLEESFANTEAGKWLAENCYKFGFILRYPKDKTDITGIDFEPWHFRYVGIKAAKEIYESGMCLEEYLENE